MIPFPVKANMIIDMGTYKFKSTGDCSDIRPYDGDVFTGSDVLKIPDYVSIGSCVLVSTEIGELWLLYGGGVCNRIPSHLICMDQDVYPVEGALNGVE